MKKNGRGLFLALLLMSLALILSSCGGGGCDDPSFNLTGTTWTGTWTITSDGCGMGPPDSGAFIINNITQTGS
ncbi:MAG: hypothetical protein JSV21_00370, partial [Nitrospirota bacterium]